MTDRPLGRDLQRDGDLRCSAVGFAAVAYGVDAKNSLALPGAFRRGLFGETDAVVANAEAFFTSPAFRKQPMNTMAQLAKAGQAGSMNRSRSGGSSALGREGRETTRARQPRRAAATRQAAGWSAWRFVPYPPLSTRRGRGRADGDVRELTEYHRFYLTRGRPTTMVSNNGDCVNDPDISRR